jgi:hypothetical protein
MSDLANRILRSFSLVVTDRRWAAPLSAAALGFGIFAGVAIGPNAAGTLAGGPQLIEIPIAGDGGEEASSEAGSEAGSALAGPVGGGGGGGALEAPLTPAPIEPAPLPAPIEEDPAPAPPPPSPSAEEPEAAEGTELTGTVADANEAAGSYAVAIEGGELVPVHAAKLPTPGTKLTVIAEQLANGSFGEVQKPERVKAKAKEIEFKGVVTYADPDVPVISRPYGREITGTSPGYTVSGRGASLLVHVDPDPSGALPELPEVGVYATVTAAIEPGGALEQREIEIEAVSPSTYLDLAGIVSEVMPESAQILLSADGSGESEADLTLTVPSVIKLPELKVGDSYLATAEVQEDGSLSLAGIASDERRKGADDPKTAQGDLKR